MTEYQKFEANEKREELFEKCGYVCQVCGKSIHHYGVPQLAHRISQGKTNLKKYGAEIIHHGYNLVPVCSLDCNDACNIGFDPIAVQELIERIKNG